MRLSYALDNWLHVRFDEIIVLVLGLISLLLINENSSENFAEEALAQESFEQQLKKDDKYWDSFFDNLIADGMFAQ